MTHSLHVTAWMAALVLMMVQPAAGQDREAHGRLQAARQAAALGESDRAVSLATEALEQQADLAEAFYLRGRERFRLGQFAESVDDFDQFARLRPEQEPRLWERGISCYYAGRFGQGATQFAAYQDVDDSDVENAVWHVLCRSQIEGLPAARRQMLRVRRDGRVPMMAIDQLFRGQSPPDEVWSAVKAAGLTDEERHVARFYAHLYLGLYYEVSGDPQQALRQLTEAVKHRIDHYMWDVARVHADRLSAAAEAAP